MQRIIDRLSTEGLSVDNKIHESQKFADDFNRTIANDINRYFMYAVKDPDNPILINAVYQKFLYDTSVHMANIYLQERHDWMKENNIRFS